MEKESNEPLQENTSAYSKLTDLPVHLPILTESTDTKKILLRKKCVTPKLVALLDRCQLSIRYSAFIIEATILQASSP